MLFFIYLLTERSIWGTFQERTNTVTEYTRNKRATPTEIFQKYCFLSDCCCGNTTAVHSLYHMLQLIRFNDAYCNLCCCFLLCGQGQAMSKHHSLVWFSELTCSFTHWMVVICAPLWSLMTRIVAPFTGLLTATRPFFPAERITWPVWGPKTVTTVELGET